MNKIKKLILVALGIMCSVSFAFSAVTYARYIFKRGNEGSITVDSDLPIDVLNKVEVNSQEELFVALENGYPYITLGEKINDPLIITQNTMEVKKSLILDLNGKEIQRVSEKAMLTVGPNVTLTIIDTKKKGSLYNPVGTVLEVSGGSLDVRGGKFESGPRTWEYYSNSNVKARVEKQTAEVTYYRRAASSVASAEGENATIEKKHTKMPIIDPVVISDENTSKLEAVNGNIYFDVAYKHGSMEQTIKADTYCYYVTSDNFVTGATIGFDATVADFSYTYYAYPYRHTKQYQYISNTLDGVKTTLSNNEPVLNTDYVEVTVYGFENDIQAAMGYPEGGATIGQINTDVNTIPNYAAVRMTSGKLSVNCKGGNNKLEAPKHTLTDGKLTETSPDLKEDAGSGSFISYFGVETAACVFFSGGNATINTQGAFATVDPKTIYDIYHQEVNGVVNGTTPATAFASEGRGICVHGAETSKIDGGTLAIDGGFFYAYSHNLVRMEAGTIDIDGDKKSLQFYKIHRVRYYNGYTSSYDPSTDPTAPEWLHASGRGGIYSGGGKIYIGEAKIYMTSGLLTQTTIGDKTTQTYTSKQGVYGVYAVGGDVELHNVDIYIRGQGCVGVAATGGTVTMTGSELTELTDEQREYYKGFASEVQEDMRYYYSSNIFVVGYNTKGVLVQAQANTTKDSTTELKASNTAIFVSRAQGNDLPTTFLSGVDVVEGEATFNNCRIQSDGYGITMTRGSVWFNNSRLAAYNASAIVLGGGNMVINSTDVTNAENQVTAIKCNLTEEYVERAREEKFTGPVRANSADLLYTYAGVDIVAGSLSIQSGRFDYTFDSNKVTPKPQDRVMQSVIDAGVLYGNSTVYGKNNSGEIIGTAVNCLGPGGFLPAESNAIRVMGAQTFESEIAPIADTEALHISNTDCSIISQCGGGILIRGGNVTLGSTAQNVNKHILIETQGKETWETDVTKDGALLEDKGYAHTFAGKWNWQYLDNKTGGDAMFVAGGDVTTYTSNLELHAANGNALLVTGYCLMREKVVENGVFAGYKFNYDTVSSANEEPTVTINGGKFVGNYKEKTDGTSTIPGFNFTGASSYYGIKVVCGGNLNIYGGDISGYGGICTMGMLTDRRVDPYARLNLSADYTNEARRIRVRSYGVDAGGFYNNSIVNIESVDNPDAKVKVATDNTPATDDTPAKSGVPAAPVNPNDFGLIVDGKNTCFVIEKYGAEKTMTVTLSNGDKVEIGTQVTVKGGFYCATKGDQNGGKVFWCDNGSGMLNVHKGWLIGNLNGGAIQGASNWHGFPNSYLKVCNVFGGYFINDCVKRATQGLGAGSDGEHAEHTPFTIYCCPQNLYNDFKNHTNNCYQLSSETGDVTFVDDEGITQTVHCTYYAVTTTPTEIGPTDVNQTRVWSSAVYVEKASPSA